MPYFAPFGVGTRVVARRPRYVLEALEERTMLSGTGASLATSQASISSMTLLKSSLTTAVAGSKIFFTATVENASTDAPITSGKVNFVVESPQKIVLGDVSVNKQGEASVLTTDLTAIANDTVEAHYTPSKSQISASTAGPVTVKVIPVPLNVPTITTLQSPITSAEVGQYVPLVATVKDAGTGNDIDAGKVEPMTGTVAFVTDSPDPVVLGEVNLNKDGQAALSTNLLKIIGSNQITAEFLPANNYFAESTSAPIDVTINPGTVNAPTVTGLQAVANRVETGEPITLSTTVQNANSGLADGVVEFVTVAPHPIVLGDVAVGLFGQQVSLTTGKLKKVGTYQIEAKYSPNTNRFAESTSAPITVTITPLTAATFRVTPVVRHGQLGKLLSFAVTALNVKKQPLTNYIGTVVFTSPTDSWTVFPKSVYAGMNLSPPPPESTGLASFNPQSYTFTPADHGSHTFYAAVTFGKGGAETLQVTQANNPKVFGMTTFSIG